jgi:hypothetical protein
MTNSVEQYHARQGGVTLHTWTEVQGLKKANFSGSSQGAQWEVYTLHSPPDAIQQR